MSPLLWHQCEVITGSRVCLPAGVPHCHGENRQQTGRCGSVVRPVGLTAADVAPLNHLTHTSLISFSMVASPSHSHRYRCRSKMKFWDPGTNWWCFSMAVRPHSLAWDLATVVWVLGGVLESVSILLCFPNEKTG